MLVIGLTGGIASGKSTISSFLQELGAVIIDADALARQVVKPGKKAWLQIRKHFGSQIIKEDQTIDRKKLAEIVFNNPGERKVLNAIIHPEVIKMTRDLIKKYKQNTTIPLIVVDAPLLIEAGMTTVVDEVWVINVDEEKQIERIMKRDKISRQKALSRISSQMPTREKLKYADRIINTNVSLEETFKQLKQIWDDIIDVPHEQK